MHLFGGQRMGKSVRVGADPSRTVLMLPSLLYAIVRLLLDVALLRCRSGAARDLDLLALRQEVRVLRRRTKRIACRPGDRLVFAALCRCLP